MIPVEIDHLNHVIFLYSEHVITYVKSELVIITLVFLFEDKLDASSYPYIHVVNNKVYKMYVFIIERICYRKCIRLTFEVKEM